MTRPHDTARPEPFRLRDGREMLIRPLRPDDLQRLVALGRRLSRRSIRLRFFTPKRSPDLAFLERLADVDFADRAAYAATFLGDDEVRAVGRYGRDGETSAEVAFVVEDSLQGQGIGTELLHHLAAHARPLGFTRFTAVVLAENRDMLDVFHNSGYPITVRPHMETYLVTLDITQPPRA